MCGAETGIDEDMQKRHRQGIDEGPQTNQEKESLK